MVSKYLYLFKQESFNSIAADNAWNTMRYKLAVSLCELQECTKSIFRIIFKITITYTENRISNQMKALIEVKLYFIVRGLNRIKNS